MAEPVVSPAPADGEPRMFSPTDPLRDLVESVIIEPLAFVASVPELLAKGKAKIASQTKTANMIGKFVVPIAKRKIDAELKGVAESIRSYLTNTEPKSGSGSRGGEPTGKPTGTPGASGPLETSVHGEPESETSDKPTAQKATAKSVGKAAGKPAATTTSKSVGKTAGTTGAKSATNSVAKAGKPQPVEPKPRKAIAAPKRTAESIVPTVNDLGLDSYDDLPASSVVALLVALTPAQLRAIAAYETTHRNRQTILGGVARLLDSAQ
jgi:hypothetical protein